ncbi:MAG: LPS export ABC transporter periplasmic protein LptC [Bacteroidetes bacterium]|nr:LPS export ABC transporter periplasmic protein LptC [Bacteroidota bacterium]
MTKQLVSYIIFILALILSSCGNDIKVVNSLASIKDYPVESSTNLQIMMSDSGKLKFKMYCPSFDSYDGEKPYRDLKEGFNAEFYNENMEVESFISAKKAKLFNNDMLMDARVDVLVVNVNGDTLKTPHLIWDREKETLISDTLVEIITEDGVTFGDGLVSDQNFEVYTILKPRGSINLDDD